MEAKTLCGQTALLAVATLAKYVGQQNVRIAHYESTGAHGQPFGHVQAQAKIDGEWRWLQVMTWPPVRIGIQEFEGEPDWYMTPHEYLQRLLSFKASDKEVLEFLKKGDD